MLTLPDPAAVADLPAAQLPALLAQLVALQVAVVARLAASTGSPVGPPPDDVVDCKTAVTLTGRSASWMRKHGHTVPGFVQPTGHGGKVGWRRHALLVWAGRAVD